LSKEIEITFPFPRTVYTALKSPIEFWKQSKKIDSQPGFKQRRYILNLADSLTHPEKGFAYYDEEWSD